MVRETPSTARIERGPAPKSSLRSRISSSGGLGSVSCIGNATPLVTLLGGNCHGRNWLIWVPNAKATAARCAAPENILVFPWSAMRELLRHDGLGGRMAVTNRTEAKRLLSVGAPAAFRPVGRKSEKMVRASL